MIAFTFGKCLLVVIISALILSNASPTSRLQSAYPDQRDLVGQTSNEIESRQVQSSLSRNDADAVLQNSVSTAEYEQPSRFSQFKDLPNAAQDRVWKLSDNSKIIQSNQHVKDITMKKGVNNAARHFNRLQLLMKQYLKHRQNDAAWELWESTNGDSADIGHSLIGSICAYGTFDQYRQFLQKIFKGDDKENLIPAASACFTAAVNVRKPEIDDLLIVLASLINFSVGGKAQIVAESLKNAVDKTWPFLKSELSLNQYVIALIPSRLCQAGNVDDLNQFLVVAEEDFEFGTVQYGIMIQQVWKALFTRWNPDMWHYIGSMQKQWSEFDNILKGLYFAMSLRNLDVWEQFHTRRKEISIMSAMYHGEPEILAYIVNCPLPSQDSLMKLQTATITQRLPLMEAVLKIRASQYDAQQLEAQFNTVPEPMRDFCRHYGLI
ncbi:hypothetical protein MP228_009804 [Amoeboaphelidium protococcarum]|nr:hypothetical protein MP228_009804 [Amoeboaphelidium protococcarum]